MLAIPSLTKRRQAVASKTACKAFFKQFIDWMSFLIGLFRGAVGSLPRYMCTAVYLHSHSVCHVFFLLLFFTVDWPLPNFRL